MNKLILPRGYLSWTAYYTWTTNKERFKNEYFMSGKKLDTPALRFGKSVATAIENRAHMDIAPNLVVYSVSEHEIRTTIDGVPILCYLDSYDPERNIFREYKTGKVPWNQAKVQKHGQLLFYAVALQEVTGKIPEYCHLDWLETVERPSAASGFFSKVDNNLVLTGNIKSFYRDFDPREIARMRADIVRVANEISEAYRQFINEL